MNAFYPCVCGRLSLDGAPLPPLASGDAEGAAVLYRRADGRAELLRIGVVHGLHVRQAEDGCRLLLGHVDAADPTAEGEVLLRAFEAAAPGAIDGAFVYARLDAAGAPRVVLRTDRYGFRPLFYRASGGVLVFASHLHGLNYLSNGSWPGLAWPALLHYYHFGVTPGEATLLDGIRKVPAGGALTATPGGLHVDRYFDLLDLYEPDAFAGAGEEGLCRLLDEQMAASVRKRSRGATCVGLALSGGVDSGFVAKKLREEGVPFRAFNLAYGDFYDEYDRIDRLEAALGITVERIRVAPVDVLRSVEEAAGLASEPTGFNDAALRILALRARAEGVQTLWDGDGADRLFLGMNSHLKYVRILRLYRLLERLHVRGPFLGVLGRSRHPEARKLYVVLRNWSEGIPAYVERTYGAAAGYDHAYERSIFALGVEAAWERYRRRIEGGEAGTFFTYLSTTMCPERFFHTPVEQQAYLGLRPVSPYWDDALVSLALSLPTAMKVRRGATKYILRRAAALDGSARYWMLPKVGLQSAFAYLKQTDEGRAWIAVQRERVLHSEAYHYLAGALNEAAPDVDRLLPFVVWHDALPGCARAVTAMRRADVVH